MVFYVPQDSCFRTQLGIGVLSPSSGTRTVEVAFSLESPSSPSTTVEFVDASALPASMSSADENIYIPITACAGAGAAAGAVDEYALVATNTGSSKEFGLMFKLSVTPAALPEPPRVVPANSGATTEPLLFNTYRAELLVNSTSTDNDIASATGSRIQNYAAAIVGAAGAEAFAHAYRWAPPANLSDYMYYFRDDSGYSLTFDPAQEDLTAFYSPHEERMVSDASSAYPLRRSWISRKHNNILTYVQYAAYRAMVLYSTLELAEGASGTARAGRACGPHALDDDTEALVAELEATVLTVASYLEEYASLYPSWPQHSTVFNKEETGVQPYFSTTSGKFHVHNAHESVDTYKLITSWEVIRFLHERVGAYFDALDSSSYDTDATRAILVHFHYNFLLAMPTVFSPDGVDATYYYNPRRLIPTAMAALYSEDADLYVRCVSKMEEFISSALTDESIYTSLDFSNHYGVLDYLLRFAHITTLAGGGYDNWPEIDTVTYPPEVSNTEQGSSLFYYDEAEARNLYNAITVPFSLIRPDGTTPGLNWGSPQDIGARRSEVLVGLTAYPDDPISRWAIITFDNDASSYYDENEFCIGNITGPYDGGSQPSIQSGYLSSFGLATIRTSISSRLMPAVDSTDNSNYAYASVEFGPHASGHYDKLQTMISVGKYNALGDQSRSGSELAEYSEYFPTTPAHNTFSFGDQGDNQYRSNGYLGSVSDSTSAVFAKCLSCSVTNAAENCPGKCMATGGKILHFLQDITCETNDAYASEAGGYGPCTNWGALAEIAEFSFTIPFELYLSGHNLIDSEGLSSPILYTIHPNAQTAQAYGNSVLGPYTTLASDGLPADLFPNGSEQTAFANGWFDVWSKVTNDDDNSASPPQLSFTPLSQAYRDFSQPVELKTDDPFNWSNMKLVSSPQQSVESIRAVRWDDMVDLPNVYWTAPPENWTVPCSPSELADGETECPKSNAALLIIMYVDTASSEAYGGFTVIPQNMAGGYYHRTVPITSQGYQEVLIPLDAFVYSSEVEAFWQSIYRVRFCSTANSQVPEAGASVTFLAVGIVENIGTVDEPERGDTMPYLTTVMNGLDVSHSARGNDIEYVAHSTRAYSPTYGSGVVLHSAAEPFSRCYFGGSDDAFNAGNYTLYDPVCTFEPRAFLYGVSTEVLPPTLGWGDETLGISAADAFFGASLVCPGSNATWLEEKRAASVGETNDGKDDESEFLDSLFDFNSGLLCASFHIRHRTANSTAVRIADNTVSGDAEDYVAVVVGQAYPGGGSNGGNLLGGVSPTAVIDVGKDFVRLETLTPSEFLEEAAVGPFEALVGSNAVPVLAPFACVDATELKSKETLSSIPLSALNHTHRCASVEAAIISVRNNEDKKIFEMSPLAIERRGWAIWRNYKASATVSFPAPIKQKGREGLDYSDSLFEICFSDKLAKPKRADFFAVSAGDDGNELDEEKLQLNVFERGTDFSDVQEDIMPVFACAQAAVTVRLPSEVPDTLGIVVFFRRRLPTWATVLIIIGVVAVIGLAVAFVVLLILNANARKLSASRPYWKKAPCHRIFTPILDRGLCCCAKPAEQGLIGQNAGVQPSEVRPAPISPFNVKLRPVDKDDLYKSPPEAPMERVVLKPVPEHLKFQHYVAPPTVMPRPQLRPVSRTISLERDAPRTSGNGLVPPPPPPPP
eukprot:gnl/Chilomastix_cuspidata/2967.p1 GENE.gnl/Chilomastix_cuspidata/2967~~gnl/Chilomastix_cuspidata/2967.p1  ORF type:complete len:1721 (+),score=323.73 gnl/Chilomastix_cuspidata/2967:153-5165(+)